MIRGFGSVAIAVAAFVALAAPARAADHVKISYVVPTIDAAPLLVAVDKGYFAEEGLEVELVQAGGGVATPALIAGDLQFSGSPSAAISAILKGAKLKVLLVGQDHSAFQLWAQPAIRTIDDLKGKQIGIISRGDTTEVSLRYILAKHDLSDDYWGYAPLGTGTARIAAITSGGYPASVIAAGEAEDMRNAGHAGNLHLLIDLHKEVRMTFGGYATSDAMIASHPDLVRHAARALFKGLSVVKSSREAMVAALANHGSTREAAAAGYDAFASSLSATGVVPAADQEFELKLRADMLGVTADTVPSPSRVFDARFVTTAAADLKAENWKP